MWTKMMTGPRKKAPKTIAVIDPDRCFGAFACSICQAACPVAGCIVEEPDRDGRIDLDQLRGDHVERTTSRSK